MEPYQEVPLNIVGQSRRLADASRQRIQNARAQITMARQRLDSTRNLLQRSWLIREIQTRQLPRGPR